MVKQRNTIQSSDDDTISYKDEDFIPDETTSNLDETDEFDS